MTLSVFCHSCKNFVGKMAMGNIGLACFEICKPCYDRLTKQNDAMREFVKEIASDLSDWSLQDTYARANYLLKEMNTL